MKKYFLTAFYIFFIFALFSDYKSFSQGTQGKTLFEDKGCIRCHTIGRGRFVGPDLYDVEKKYDKEQILLWSKNPQLIYEELNKRPVNQGYPPMPSFEISDTEAREIANFLINNDIKKSGTSGGNIVGNVVNKTTGESAEGIDIYLQSFIGDRKTGENLAITDNEGKFAFNGLKWDNSYSIRIKSEGIEYETAKMVFPVDKDEILLDLPIFDSTDDSSVIDVMLNHQVIGIDDKIASVAEIYEIENKSNSIYTGKKDNSSDLNRTLTFFVPNEATNVKFIEGVSGDNTLRGNNTVSDTVSVTPGKKRVVITYELPLSFGNNEIEKDYIYNTSNALVLIADSGDKIILEGLEELEPITVEDQSYKRWVGKDLKPGGSLKISLYSSKIDYNRTELLPVIIFALFFIAVSIFISLKKAGGQIKYSPVLEKEKVISEIAKLDLLFESNQIDQREYKLKRKKLLDSLPRMEKS